MREIPVHGADAHRVAEVLVLGLAVGQAEDGGLAFAGRGLQPGDGAGLEAPVLLDPEPVGEAIIELCPLPPPMTHSVAS